MLENSANINAEIDVSRLLEQGIPVDEYFETELPNSLEPHFRQAQLLVDEQAAEDQKLLQAQHLRTRILRSPHLRWAPVAALLLLAAGYYGVRYWPRGGEAPQPEPTILPTETPIVLRLSDYPTTGPAATATATATLAGTPVPQGAVEGGLGGPPPTATRTATATSTVTNTPTPESTPTPAPVMQSWEFLCADGSKITVSLPVDAGQPDNPCPRPVIVQGAPGPAPVAPPPRVIERIVTPTAETLPPPPEPTVEPIDLSAVGTAPGSCTFEGGNGASLLVANIPNSGRFARIAVSNNPGFKQGWDEDTQMMDETGFKLMEGARDEQGRINLSDFIEQIINEDGSISESPMTFNPQEQYYLMLQRAAYPFNWEGPVYKGLIFDRCIDPSAGPENIPEAVAVALATSTPAPRPVSLSYPEPKIGVKKSARQGKDFIPSGPDWIKYGYNQACQLNKQDLDQWNRWLSINLAAERILDPGRFGGFSADDQKKLNDALSMTYAEHTQQGMVDDVEPPLAEKYDKADLDASCQAALR